MRQHSISHLLGVLLMIPQSRLDLEKCSLNIVGVEEDEEIRTRQRKKECKMEYFYNIKYTKT